MADARPLFPTSEYTARVERLQAELKAAGTEALLLTDPAGIFYVTGFLTRFWASPTRPWYVIVPASGAPIAIIPSIGEPLMRQTWISEIRSWDAPAPDDDGLSLVAEALAACVPAAGSWALSMGAEMPVRMPLGDIDRLRARLAPRKVRDATPLLRRVREIKSPAEIAKIRETCAVAGRAFDRLDGIVAEGQTLAKVFRMFQAALLDEGADWVDYLAGAAGAEGYRDVIAPATEAPVSPGDVLMLDTGAVRDGYFCDFDRNVALGAPSAAVARTQEALWRATEDTLAALQPGLRAADAHRLLAEGVQRHGGTPCGGRFGHGLGLSLTEWPSLMPSDMTELRPGMVLTLEPSAFVTDTTFLVHEENIVVRADGVELLSPRAPRQLPEIGR